MKSQSAEAPSDPEVGQGVRIYSTVLQGAGGTQIQALMREGGDRGVCAALYTAPPYDLHVPGMDVARLSLNLTPSCVTGGIDGDRTRSFDAHRYSLFLAPAGAEMRWRKEAPSRHLTIYFRPDLFADSDEPAVPLVRRQAFHNLIVPGLRPLADQLVDELRHGGPHDTDAADCLARLLLIQVSRHLGKTRQEPGGMDPTSIARLKDYVMAHLGERILVADLASHLGMPIDRFAWAFKARTGKSPHQFVVALRLQQAGDLLRTSRLPIADVALACGFASQQHLTNSLRRHAGVTPARLRQGGTPDGGPAPRECSGRPGDAG
jgi:AraC family transcriptional regulator